MAHHLQSWLPISSDRSATSMFGPGKQCDGATCDASVSRFTSKQFTLQSHRSCIVCISTKSAPRDLHRFFFVFFRCTFPSNHVINKSFLRVNVSSGPKRQTLHGLIRKLKSAVPSLKSNCIFRENVLLIFPVS